MVTDLQTIMSGRFGRFPSEDEVTALRGVEGSDDHPHLDALLEIAAVEQALCEAVVDKTCLLIGRANFQPHLGVTQLAADELDALPFGVIGLDEKDHVQIYNRWQARFSRLLPTEIIGKNWFRDVAPCTRVDAFEGRYRAFTSDAIAEPAVQFDFAFDFKHGRRKVSIVLMRGREMGWTLIAVTLPYLGCLRDTRILLRFLSLAMASGDHEHYARQVKTWYVDFLPSIGIPAREVYLNMSNLGDTLPDFLTPSTTQALRAPLQMSMQIVEAAMLAAEAPETP